MAEKINKVHLQNLIEEIKWFTGLIERHKQLGDVSQLDQYVAKRNSLYSELAIELVKVSTSFKSDKLSSVLTHVVSLIANQSGSNLDPMPRELETSLEELETVVQ
jgi:hypothetical protein